MQGNFTPEESEYSALCEAPKWSRLNRSPKVSAFIIAPSPTIRRAQVRLEQAEAIIAGLSAMYERIAVLFGCRPAAKDERAMAISRARLRASA
jgi:hypothetical protein